MLFLEKGDHSFESMYFELLISYSQVDKYNDLQVVKVSNKQAKTLGLETLPIFLDKTG